MVTKTTLDRFSLDNILAHAHAEVNRIVHENMEMRCQLEVMTQARDYAVNDMEIGTALVAKWKKRAEKAEEKLASAHHLGAPLLIQGHEVKSDGR